MSAEAMTRDTIEPRTRRAATESMVVDPEGPGLFACYSGTDSVYRVFTPSGSEGWRCECSDHHHRQVQCKHCRRVQMTLGQRPIPDVPGVDAVLHKQRGEDA